MHWLYKCINYLLCSNNLKLMSYAISIAGEAVPDLQSFPNEKPAKPEGKDGQVDA